jgi:peptidoglycan/LPS O-acetylase OafA/YrhL
MITKTALIQMGEPAAPVSRTRRIPQLDGLRGLAILLVVSQHYFGFLAAFSFGWVGLDLFFVLSGYLITGRLLAKQKSPGYFRDFYRNRALRILPLYYTVLILFFLGIHFFVRKENLPLLSYYTIHWKSFFIFTQNWTFIIYGVPGAIYLLHFWSLAAEEQFYLVWPALIYILVGNRPRILLCLVILPVVIIIRLVIFFCYPGSGNGINIFFNTICRLDSFVIGALLCEIHYAKIRIPAKAVNLVLALSVIAIATSLFVFKNVGPSNAFFGTIGTTFTAIVCACLLHKSVEPSANAGAPGLFTAARFFNARVLRFFGKISYGLYVIHFPVILLLDSRLFDWGIHHLSWSPLVMRISAAGCCLIISLLLSLSSFRYFESFFLRLKRS